MLIDRPRFFGADGQLHQGTTRARGREHMSELARTSTPGHRRVEVLLNTLRAERHLRRPLLLEAVDSLAVLYERNDALDAARDLLARLDVGIDDGEYERRISRILELVFQPDEPAVDRDTAA
jgi:hypothetical protein